MNDDASLILCVWTGEAFEPRPGQHMRRAQAAFGAGELVVIEAMHERSRRSHNHQFAEVADAWANLPEHLSEMPYAKSPKALRKHALCVTGYCDVQTIDAGSKAAAARVGAYLSVLATKAHGYAIVKIEGPVVRVFTPESQSMRAMGAKRFQTSKTDVLAWVSALIQGEAA